jgi:hypothetical protein
MKGKVYESEGTMSENEKPYKKLPVRCPRYEARIGDDPEYPVDAYTIVGELQDEYYENSYVNIEAASRDFPDIQMVSELTPPKFIKPKTCPFCGQEDPAEGDNEIYDNGERWHFHCPICNTLWNQWDEIERIPYSIELQDGREFEIPVEKSRNDDLEGKETI